MYNNKKIISFLLALSLTLGLSSGCSNSQNDISGEKKQYDTGEHIISEVNMKSALFDKGSGTYHLEAPLGYKVIDYDYDCTSNLLVFHDYVYQNIVPIETSDRNKIGNPVDKDYKGYQPQDGIYAPGEHILVKINDNFSLGKEAFMTLEAPYGYEIVDYDYDKTSLFLEFENVVYRNVLPVKVSNLDAFGIPVLDNETVQTKDYYDSGDHVVVDLKMNVNFWLGKNDQFGLTAPDGYIVTDYDYDKNDSIEFQTITYKNIIPVSKIDNNFGKPLVEQEKEENGFYNPGEHVIVKVERSINPFGIGKNETKELTSLEGYEILDYDYEYGEDYQFETYVYTNNEKVYAEDINDFGKVLKK